MLTKQEKKAIKKAYLQHPLLLDHLRHSPDTSQDKADHTYTIYVSGGFKLAMFDLLINHDSCVTVVRDDNDQYIGQLERIADEFGIFTWIPNIKSLRWALRWLKDHNIDGAMYIQRGIGDSFSITIHT